jgi:hypothetical protein
MGLVTTEIKGVAQLTEQFKGMETPARIRKFALRVLVESAKPIRDAIRAEAPVAEKDTKGRYAHKRGALKRGVKYKASRLKEESGQKTIAYVVGPFGKGTSQRHLIVGGHKITGHNAYAFQGRVKPAAYKGISRSGERTKADPFVQRGVERSKEAATTAAEGMAARALEVLAHG